MGLPNRRWLEPEYVGGGGEDDGDGATGGHGADPGVADLGKERAAGAHLLQVGHGLGLEVGAQLGPT